MTKALFKFLFPAVPGDADPYAQQITAEAIDILYRSLFRAGVTFSLMPIVTVWVFWSHIEHRVLVGWSVLAYLTIAASLILLRFYFRRTPSVTESTRWGRYCTYIALMTGFIWGSAALIFFVPGSAALQVYLYIVILTLSVGSVVILAYWIESYYALAIPIFTMVAISFVRAEDATYTGLLIGLIPSLVMLTHVAVNARSAALASLRLRFENLDLVDRLREEKNKAETASRDKTRFLASASHDLRQPVHALTLFTHALREELKDDAPGTLLDDMTRSIEALNQLLISLLDISKLDANIIKPNLSHFDLRGLADVLHAEYAPQAQAKGLSFRVHAGAEVIVYSDRTLLETMLRNLISNAIRYTNVGRIEVEFKQQEEKVRVEVRDTGIGIAHFQHEDVFREFYQVTNPERDRSKGLGLGLAIFKRLAALLNHPIEMDSQLGQGSCFSIVIPAGERAAMNTEALPLIFSKRDLDGMRVLVIDDEMAVREGMRVVLNGWGCDAILAGSEEEALEKMQNCEPPHAIISDYRLRDGKTGAQAIESLRNKFSCAIPALIVTGDTDPERLREAKASGNTLIHKPAQPGNLRAYLRNVRRRQA